MIFKLYFIKFCIITISFSFLAKSSTGQTKQDEQRFEYWQAETNTIYTPLPGFAFFGKINGNDLGTGVILSGQIWSLINNDRFLISFEPYLVRAGWGDNDSIANTAYLRGLKMNVDSASKPFQYLVTDSMLRSINASKAVIYISKVKQPYRQSYSFLKTVVFIKEDIGGMKLHFFAKNKSQESEIDRLIQQTWGIIKFRPDSLFHPTIIKDKLVGKFRYLRPKQSKEDSLRLIQQNYHLYLRASKASLKTKDYATARMFLEQASQIHPDSPSVIIGNFLLFFEQNKLDSASEYLDQLNSTLLHLAYTNLKLSSKYLSIMLYDKKNMPDLVITIARNIIKEYPNNENAYKAIGTAYKKTGRYKKAIAAYQKAHQIALATSPKSKKPAFYDYQIGDCYLLQRTHNSKQKAKLYFIKAKEGGCFLPDSILQKFRLFK